MKNFIICMALVLPGCTNWMDGRRISENPTELEEILLLDSYLILQDEFGIISESCAKQFQKTRIIRIETLEETDYYCDINQDDVSGTSFGCYHFDNGWAGHKNTPTITYWENAQYIENIIFHEAAHWMQGCMYPETQNPNDWHDYYPIWNFVDSGPMQGQYETIKKEYK